MLLINPASTTFKFGGFLNRFVPRGIPVGIGCIAAYMEKNGIKCNIVNEEIYEITPSVLRDSVGGLEYPYVFGISCLTAHIGRGYQLAKMIKTEFPESILVFGGLHPTNQPEEVLAIPEIDYVVRGEGEEVMLRLYRALRGDGDPLKIMGVSFVRDGVLHNNPQAPLIPDLDQIPSFPYHLFDHPIYDKGFLTTSRGCPYRCSYCSIRTMTGVTYRYRSAEKIVEDIELLVNKYNQKSILFYDDNFCLNARRVHDLCDMLIERKLHEKVDFSMQTRADNVLINGGESLVQHMAEAGFRYMQFGLETGVQRLADLIRKDETVECHLKTADLCRKHGIKVTFLIIFGLPTETDDDRENSFQVVKKARVSSTKYNNIIPYPGTPIWSELKDSGRVVVTENWENFNSALAMSASIFDKTPLPYVPDTCSEWQLKRDIIRYNIRSQLSWQVLKTIFKSEQGSGFILLPKFWFFKPRELLEVFKIALQVAMNITIVSLPLWLTEPIMIMLNPALKNRSKVKDYNPQEYKIIDWDKIEMKKVNVLLSKARQELKSTGKFNVLVDDLKPVSAEITKSSSK